MNVNSPLKVDKSSESNQVFNFSLNVFASLVAATLIYFGTWLANHQIPDETGLRFSLIESRAGHLSSWSIKIYNSSDVAFYLDISQPKLKVIAADYSISGTGVSGWKGSLGKGQALDIIFIVADSPNRLSFSTIEGLLRATYQERNSATGFIESKQASIEDGGLVTIVRILLTLFWFLLPISLGGLTLWGGIRLHRWWKCRWGPTAGGG
jgi:hypothetical protein